MVRTLCLVLFSRGAIRLVAFKVLFSLQSGTTSCLHKVLNQQIEAFLFTNKFSPLTNWCMESKSI